MPRAPAMLTWRILWIWYLTAFVFCVAGALAHDQLYTTEIWRRWSETRYDPGSFHLAPVWSDIGRASVGVWLSFLGMRWLQVVSRRHERKIGQANFAPYESTITAVAATAALFFAYYVLPVNFFLECLALKSSGVIAQSVPMSLGEIWRSYLLYSLYVIGLWLGMVYPVFFFFIRSIRADYGRWKSLDQRADQFDAQNAEPETLDQVWHLWERRHYILRNVAEHYVPVLIFVLVLFAFEKLVFHVSATNGGDYSGLGALSLMLVPAGIITAIIFTMLYSREREQTGDWFANVVTFAEQRGDLKLQSAASLKLGQLDAFTDLKFLWQVLSSRGLVLVFFFSIGNVAVQYYFPSIVQAVSGSGTTVQSTSKSVPTATIGPGPAH